MLADLPLLLISWSDFAMTDAIASDIDATGNRARRS
jgi:hypothetical protein